jgi:hypothetical protein
MDTHSAETGRRLVESGGLRPVLVGIDEMATLVGSSVERGKSSLLAMLAAEVAMRPGCGLVLFDGKSADLEQWRSVVDTVLDRRRGAGG